jgi:ribosome maturation factor RimP
VGSRARLFCYLNFRYRIYRRNQNVKRRNEERTKPVEPAPAEIAAPMLERVAALLEPSVEALGFLLVRVHSSGGRRPVLQIMIERLDGANITVDDCALVSQNVSALLDVEDVIPGAYMLEVSSPGIDRPLTRAEDYARFAGYEAKIELGAPLGGRKRFAGLLCGLDGDEAIVDVEGEKLRLPVRAIAKAKLVLTDALIDATRDGLIPPPRFLAAADGAAASTSSSNPDGR